MGTREENKNHIKLKLSRIRIWRRIMNMIRNRNKEKIRKWDRVRIIRIVIKIKIRIKRIISRSRTTCKRDTPR